MKHMPKVGTVLDKLVLKFNVMRTFLLLISLSLATVTLAQDQLTVIYVKGKVIDAKTDQVVRRGSKLTTADKLKYSSKNDMIAAISPTKGRIIIKPDQKKQKKGSELLFVIKDIYLPMKGNAMTRSVGGKMGFANAAIIKAYFQQNAFLLLPNENRIAFDEEEFPLNEDSFFFIRYDYAFDDEPVNKKLPHEGKEVIIRKRDLLTVEDRNIHSNDASNFVLFYVRDGEAVGLTALNFYFPERNELQSELKIIKESGVENPWAEASAYAQEAYGNYDVEALKAFFDKL